MEAGDSDTVSARKRTESYGAGNDSDVSDGWNFVEHIDTNQPDVPSSDGESVEVIEPDNDSTGEVEEQQVADVEEKTQPAVQSPTVMPTDERDLAVVDLPNNEPRHEEMFDTSFCWFLFFSVTAVILSNVVFMAAESGFDWNVDLNILENTPSFLRDLPVTPKIPSQERIRSTWTSKEDEVAGKDVNPIGVRQLIDGIEQSVGDCKNKLENLNPKVEENVQHQKSPLKINNVNIGNHFKHLGDASDSVNAQNNFAQTLLILDALNIGLNDLEEVVTDNSELKNTLKLQKEQLHEVLREIEFDISRAMDKIASNVLFRVQKLERSFEREWCELEKSGHKDELKGLFYECPEFNEKEERVLKGDSKHSEDKSKNSKNYKEKSSNKDYRHYQVDKDSTGKYYSKSEGIELENNKYSKHEKNGRIFYENYASEIFKDKYSTKEKMQNNVKSNVGVSKKVKGEHFQDENSPIFDGSNNYESSVHSEGDLKKNIKGVRFEETKKKNLQEGEIENFSYNDNGNHHKEDSEEYDSNSIKSKDKSNKYDNSYPKSVDTKDSYKFNKHETHKYKYEQSREKKYEYNILFDDDSCYKQTTTIKKIGKYLEETCKKIGEKAKSFNVYENLRKSIKEKAKIPIELFNNMFEKYCRVSGKDYKNQHFNKENVKGEFRGKSYEKRDVSKDTDIIEDSNLDIKNIFEFNVEETTTGKQESKSTNPPSQDKVIEPKSRPRQWTFSYEEPLPDNKTKNNGDWFLKSGESRSKTRWTHHRSDWLFDRASYRRHGPYHFPERRKNWFFRRAYARQQCRETPYDEWCNFPQDDKVTLPTSKFR